MRRDEAPSTLIDPVEAMLADAGAWTRVSEELEHVERRLAELERSPIALIPRIGRSRGVRLHPLVTLLAAMAVDYREERRITVAAVGELLHTTTLLHEDICDAGAYRRGRPVARMGYGNGLSVLIGDFCYARALQAVAELGDEAAIRSIADVVVRISEGEVTRLHSSGECDLDREQHARIVGNPRAPAAPPPPCQWTPAAAQPSRAALGAAGRPMSRRSSRSPATTRQPPGATARCPRARACRPSALEATDRRFTGSPRRAPARAPAARAA